MTRRTAPTATEIPAASKTHLAVIGRRRSISISPRIAANISGGMIHHARSPNMGVRNPRRAQMTTSGSPGLQRFSFLVTPASLVASSQEGRTTNIMLQDPAESQEGAKRVPAPQSQLYAHEKGRWPVRSGVLVPVRADQPSDLGLHQCLRQHPDTFGAAGWNRCCSALTDGFNRRPPAPPAR